MATRLFIESSGSRGWLSVGETGSSWRAGQPLPPDTELIAIVPANTVGLHTVTVPARREAELRQAVPYALEERLAEPVEVLHFALGTRRCDAIEVAVVARRALQQWLDALRERGLTPAHLHADAQLMPREPECIHLAQVGDRVLLGLADAAHAVAAADWPGWQALLPALPRRVLGSDGRFRDAETPELLDTTSLLRYAARHDIRAPDLLQGAFAPTRRRVRQQRQWRQVAALAAAAALLVLAEAVIGWSIERGDRERLRAETTALFEQTLPGMRMTADPAAQLAAELASRRGGGAGDGPFAVLNEVAPLITQGSHYRLQGLDYRDGAFELEVMANDVGRLDLLRETIATRGLSVELTGVDPGDDGVRGRLRLRQGGA